MPFFMLIPGIDGGSRDIDHRGWFEIDSYGLDLIQGPGRTTFGPLNVTLTLDDGLTTLLADTAAGRAYPGIRIEGVRPGEDPFTFSTLTLADVRFTGVQDNQGPEDRLSFRYDRIGLTTRAQNEDGSAGASESFGFDIRTNTIIPPPDPTLIPGNSGGFTVAPAARYFLLIPGLDGGSADENHQGWFEVSDYGLNLAQRIGTGPGAGSGAGRADFSPLTVTLETGTALPDLLSHIATGRHLPGVRLEGETALGDVVSTLTLADVQVSELHELGADDGLAGDGLTDDSLSFTYGQIGLVTRSQDETGAFGPDQSFGFDVARNLVIPPPDPVLTADLTAPDGASDDLSAGSPSVTVTMDPELLALWNAFLNSLAQGNGETQAAPTPAGWDVLL